MTSVLKVVVVVADSTHPRTSTRPTKVTALARSTATTKGVSSSHPTTVPFECITLYNNDVYIRCVMASTCAAAGTSTYAATMASIFSQESRRRKFTPARSRTSWKTSEDFRRLQKTSEDFRRLQKTSEDFRRLQKTSEDFRRLLR